VHTPLNSLLGRPSSAPEPEKESEKEKAKEKLPVVDPFSVGGVPSTPKVPTGPISKIGKASGKGGAKGAAAEAPAEPAKDAPMFEPVVAPVVMPTTPAEWSPTPKGRGLFGSILGAWDRFCSLFTKPK
jgi:hypothetical protein